MKFDELHPAWVAHFLFALTWQGYSEPRINKRGKPTARRGELARSNLLSSDEGIEAVAQAMLLADFASGAAIGYDSLQDVLNGSLPDSLQLTAKGFFADHREFLGYLVMSNEFVVQHVKSQLKSEER